MSKKILILTGSPRSNGNSFMLADAFAEGAGAAGHSVRRFDTARAEVDGCRACNQCFKYGKACVFDGDFNTLAPMLEETDVLVFATPLYWFSFPAQLKAAIDKIYSLLVGKRPLKIRECVLLVTAETEEMEDFAGIVRTYELIADYLNWKDRGKVLVPNVNLPGDIKGAPALEEARNLGKKHLKNRKTG